LLGYVPSTVPGTLRAWPRCPPTHLASGQMRPTIIASVIISLAVVGVAHAQTSSGSGGASGSTGGSTSSGTGSPTTRAPSGSPGLTPTPSGPITPNRSNSEVFPPSRVLPGTQGQVPNQTGTPGSTAITPETGTPSGGSRVPSPATGGVGSSQQSKTGKNAARDELADCLKLWDAGTHMSKADWARTCRRVQGRLDNIKSQSGTSAARSGRSKLQ